MPSGLVLTAPCLSTRPFEQESLSRSWQRAVVDLAQHLARPARRSVSAKPSRRRQLLVGPDEHCGQGRVGPQRCAPGASKSSVSGKRNTTHDSSAGSCRCAAHQRGPRRSRRSRPPWPSRRRQRGRPLHGRAGRTRRAASRSSRTAGRWPRRHAAVDVVVVGGGGGHDARRPSAAEAPAGGRSRS